MKLMARPLLRPALLLLASAAAAQPAGVADLPLVELPADSERPYLAVFPTGDGGWAELDRQISAHLIAAGIPVVGWNSLKYYWVQRSPEEASRDLERILGFCQGKWRKSRVLLVGYSRGADVLPFLASRLSPDRFEPLATEYIHLGARALEPPLALEVGKLRGLRILGLAERIQDRRADPALGRRPSSLPCSGCAA